MIQMNSIEHWFPQMIDIYRKDPHSVYNTWFANEKRLKYFRSIRKGVMKVMEEIKAGSFGNDFKDSSLESVLHSICEQKEVFQGASHAFIWKPKLRIPDIYENEENKRAFGTFLEACLSGQSESALLQEVDKLAKRNIKGLGPAVANILYFLHPTIFPPFNTAMVEGFNLLFQQKAKLGSWESYLYMRQLILQVNNGFRSEFSKDLGMIAGLLFEVGTREILPPMSSGIIVEMDDDKVRKYQEKRSNSASITRKEENAHQEQQYLLSKLGWALGYDVWIASNDHGKEYRGEKLGSHSLDTFPSLPYPQEVIDTAKLIDVIWFKKNTNHIEAIFEVESTTSIYSGILRMYDLSFSLGRRQICYLVAPKSREKEILAQVRRPSFQDLADMELHYLFFEEICDHCEAMCKFGNDKEVLHKLAKVCC
jgi:type II restriction enzyme